MEHIDLHMHSSFSDGTDTPEEIVIKAKEAGIGMISLTDHNTLAGIEQFRDACRRHGQTGIDGIELSAGYPEPGTPPGKEPVAIHVLGYFPPDSDFSSEPFQLLQDAIREYRKTKIRHNEAMVRLMAEAGIGGGRISVDGFNAFARSVSSSGNYNRVHIARYLEHLGVVRNKDEAMDIYIGKECPYYVVRETITVQTAIEAIHAAGGIAVIAHPGEYHLEGKRLEAFFDYCLEHKIDGLERLHPHNTPATACAILAFAKRFREETGEILLLTAGSDYHGTNKKNLPALPWMPPYAWSD